MTVIINGKELRDKILADLKKESEKLSSKPNLSVIIVGDDPASRIYVNNKKKTALEVGFDSQVYEMSSLTSEAELLKKIDELNKADSVNAILVQLPLPSHIDSKKVIEAIDPKKDVDCFHPYNAGKIASHAQPYVYPCTPKGIISLLKEYNISPSGRHVVVVGRSNIVGRPLAQMFLNLDATVTVCHSKTQNLKDIVKTADILVSAVGKANLITGDMVKKGAAVFDVGMNRVETENGKKLTGDIDFEGVKENAAFITPVPGGVGPMTIASLMENTLALYKLQNN